MNTRNVRMIAFALAAAMASAPAHGESSDLDNAGSVAGILAGVAAAGTIITEATTRSGISIVVDVYQDTEYAPGKPAFPEDPQDRRTDGFRLGKPAAGFYENPGEIALRAVQKRRLEEIKDQAAEKLKQIETLNLPVLPEPVQRAVRNYKGALEEIGAPSLESLSASEIAVKQSAVSEAATEVQKLVAATKAAENAGIIESTEAQKDALDKTDTLSRLTIKPFAVTSNSGAIVNEATQPVLAQNAMIDEIVAKKNESKWKRINFAKSKNGPGNSNTIIYLANPTMPIIKEAAYNPNNFVVANKQVFEQGFLSLGNLVKLPGADAGATSAGDVNAWKIREKLQAASAARDGNAKKLQAAFARLLALQAEKDPSVERVKTVLASIGESLGASAPSSEDNGEDSGGDDNN